MSSSPPSLLTTTQAWFRFLLLGAIVGALVALAASIVVPPDYTAKVTLIVTPPKSATIDYGALQATQALAPTFAELSTTTPVLDRVIATTKADTDATKLALAVSTHVPTGTALIEISVSNKDANLAAAIANAIASELVDYASTSGTEIASLQVTLSVVDPATPPTVRSGPGLLVSTALGAAIGLFIEIGLVYLLENLRQAGRQPTEAAEAAGGAPALAEAGLSERAGGGR